MPEPSLMREPGCNTAAPVFGVLALVKAAQVQGPFPVYAQAHDVVRAIFRLPLQQRGQGDVVQGHRHTAWAQRPAGRVLQRWVARPELQAQRPAARHTQQKHPSRLGASTQTATSSSWSQGRPQWACTTNGTGIMNIATPITPTNTRWPSGMCSA